MTGRRLTGLVVLVLVSALAAAQQERSAGSDFRVSPLLASHTVAPGESLSERLRIVNPGDVPIVLSVTPRDFTTDADGADTWHAFGSRPDSLGDWLTFKPSYIELPAGAETFIDYEIRVPATVAGQTPVGSRWSALAVRSDAGRRPFLAPPDGATESTVGMKVSLVYAIKIYVSVAGTEYQSLSAVALERGEDSGSLRATFANRGNVVLRPRVWMEIRNLEGAVLGSVESLKWTLQPRAEHHYRFALGDLRTPLPDGDYQVVVLADYGGAELEGLAASLVLEGEPGER